MSFIINKNRGENVFTYRGDVIEVSISPGKYKFEVWGAEGGTLLENTEGTSGKGGYSYGIAYIKSKTVLYIYIGEGGKVCGFDGCPQTYNGGGASGSGLLPYFGGGSGGGATDIRTKKGESWSSDYSLESRILVAGGGGGANGWESSTRDNGGYGGGIEGGIGYGNVNSSGGSFENGYLRGIGQAGRDGTKHDGSWEGAGGGGGGWFGGNASTSGDPWTAGSGGGGSGFADNKFFFVCDTIAGNELIPSPYGESQIHGNSGNGAAKITWLVLFSQCQKASVFAYNIMFFVLIILK